MIGWLVGLVAAPPVYPAERLRFCDLNLMINTNPTFLPAPPAANHVFA